jgi:hypothetical protein
MPDFAPLTPGVAAADLLVARLLVLELSAAEPRHYDRILLDADLVPGRHYRDTPGRRARWGATFGVLLLLAPLAVLQRVVLDNPEWGPAYLRWRLIKTDCSPRDRFRTREEWVSRLKTANGDEARGFLLGATRELRHVETPTAVVDEIVTLAERSPPRVVTTFWLREFVAGLQTANAQNRARLHAALVELAPRAYPELPPDAKLLEQTNPANDSPDKARKVYQDWSGWLARAESASPKPPEAAKKP